MSNDEAFKTFAKVFDENDAEHAFEQDPYWGRLLKRWEKRSQEWLDHLMHHDKKVAKPGNVMPPSTAQSAFLSPEDETPLFNVTSEKKPFWQKTKKFVSDVDFGIEDWNVLGRVKNGNTKYDVLLGEKVEFRTIFDSDNHTKRQINAGYNVRNGKSRLKYSVDTPYDGKDVEIFMKDDNYGVTAGYTNKLNNWYLNGSADKEDAAVSFGINKKISSDYSIKVGFFTNFHYIRGENSTIGLHGRILFHGR